MGVSPARAAPSAVAPATDVPRAVLWMLGSIAAFCLMGVGGRELTAELDTFEIMSFRSLIGLAVVVAVALATGRAGAIRARRMPLHLTRNAAHFAGQNLWFFALSAIPLAQVFAIEFTSPLWVALTAPLVLGERLTTGRVVAALAGFVGILAVARPFGGGALDPGQGAAALAAVCFAATTLATKRLTRTESLTSIMFWLTAMQAAMGLVTALADGSMAFPSRALAPWMVIVALAGLGAHLCLTTALSLAPASVIAPVDFLRLPVITVVGIALYEEALDPWVVLGAAVIVGANWLNLRWESRARGARAT